MTDVATAVEEMPPDPEPVGRRLWERFSLSVLAFLLLLLGQASFGILVRDYSETFKIAPGPLVFYLVFGVLAGFSVGIALVLPRRLRIRHPRRGITFALLPLVVTALNVMVALGFGGLPFGLLQFASTHLIGLQPVASLLLGVAAASATYED